VAKSALADRDISPQVFDGIYLGWTVPQKIYNYLAIEKPIFAVVPPNGSAAEVIKKTKSGIIVDSSETKKISEKLIEVHKMWKMNQLSIQSDKIAIQEYERRHGTRQLVDIFNRISD
jgi:glycosyltransferase involved in cell wall biosynthesis